VLEAGPGTSPRMIKSILVALDGSEHADATLQHALWLAERLRATVLGLHVIDVVSIEGSFLHDISGSLGFEPYLDFSAKMRDALRERGRVLLETFARRCAERSVPSDTTLGMGIVANEICDQARMADLVVIGHRGVNEQFSTGLLGSTTESVTRKSPKPVFVSPIRFREISRPVLAYDGSQRASAAMHAAAEVASALGLPLTVLHVTRDDGENDAKALNEARRYLHSYDLALTCESVSGYPHQKIVDFIRDRDHDLLFIGAYGHSRIIEMVLGSTTEYVLRNSPAPVFLAR
jgi:nucleotide-binding universal stress UspA family protein